MASIYLQGHIGGNDTANFATVGGASAHAGEWDAVALGFGYDSSAWPDNILRTYVGRFACGVSSTDVTGTKIDAGGFNCVSYVHSAGTSGGSWYKYTTAGGHGDTDSILHTSRIPEGGFASVTPEDGYRQMHQYDFFRLRFEHDNAVDADPVYAWISSGSGGTVDFEFASVMICEVSATGITDWQKTPGNSSKLELTTVGGTDTQHNWYIGLSVIPYSQSVGFCNWGFLQISVTYS